jgi:hypothetical protein
MIRMPDFGWWNADGRNEGMRLLLDDDVDELGQLATCIVELTEHIYSSFIFKTVDGPQSGGAT